MKSKHDFQNWKEQGGETTYELDFDRFQKPCWEKGLLLLLIRLVRAAPQVQVERAWKPERGADQRLTEPAARSPHLGAPAAGPGLPGNVRWVLRRGRQGGERLLAEKDLISNAFRMKGQVQKRWYTRGNHQP